MAGRILLLSGAALALALPSAPASAAVSCPGADTTISALTLGSARDAVLCIVNAERTARGLNALAQDGALERAAQGHSEDMVTRGFFDHVGPDGRDAGGRIDAAGYAWGAYAENIAAGQSTPRRVMAAWMNSAGHCRNILDPGVTELGVGVAALAATLPGGAGTWTQNFGRPQGVPAATSDTGPRSGCPYGALAGLEGAVAPSPGVPAEADASSSSGGRAGEEPTGSGTGTGIGSGTGTGSGGPGQTDALVPGAAAAVLTLDLRRSGRRLVVRGAAVGSRVRVAIVRRGRVVRRGSALVRNGRYRLRLRRVPRSGPVAVRVRDGIARVTRTIG